MSDQRPAARPVPAPALSDGFVALWVVLWLVVGVWTGYEVWQLSELSSTVADSGRALDGAGSALQSLSSIPVVGDTPEQLGGQVRANAADIVTSAQAAGTAVRRLSILLGVTIALLPSAPVVVLQVQARRAAAAGPGAGG